MIDKNKAIKIALSIVGLLIIIAIIITIFTPKDDSPRPLLTITNINNYPINDKLDQTAIENQVYAQVLKDDKEDDKDSTITYTGTIRDGSFTLDGEAVKNITSGKVSFLLDVEQIARSWKVTVTYLNKNIVPSGISTSCPSEEEQKYPNDAFCVPWSMQGPQPKSVTEDTLIKELPYISSSYSIHYARNTPGNVEIIVKIGLNYNEQTARFFETHKASSIEWIKSTGVNPDDYTIIWRDISGETISSNQ